MVRCAVVQHKTTGRRYRLVSGDLLPEPVWDHKVKCFMLDKEGREMYHTTYEVWYSQLTRVGYIYG